MFSSPDKDKKKKKKLPVLILSHSQDDFRIRITMEYRKLVNEAHLMVLEFLQSQGYRDALEAFEREASTVLEDIPKSMPTPKPLLEVLTDITMSQLHSRLGQLNMPR